MTTSETSLACNFEAIPEDERDRHTEVATNLFESIRSVEELEDGYAFVLPPEPSVLSRAGEFIARERLCCPFFQFDLEVKANNGPIRLTLTGDASVKQYIEDTVLTEWDF